MTAPTAPAAPKAKRAKRTAKPAKRGKGGTPRVCACGCGKQTGGGTFRPGHDSKLHGEWARWKRGEGPAPSKAALKVIRERGWTWTGGKDGERKVS